MCFVFLCTLLCFNANFLPNGSDKRQQSGWIKAVGCWFESGWCAGALRGQGLKKRANSSENTTISRRISLTNLTSVQVSGMS